MRTNHDGTAESGLGLRHMMVAVALMAIATTSAPVSAKPKATWSRTFGTFCIQGIPVKDRKVTGTSNINGVEAETFDVDYKHSKDSDPWPVVRVFKDIPTAPHPLAECSELVGEAVVEGRVRYLKISGGRETVPGEPKAVFMLPEQALDIEIVRGRAEMKLYGGTMRVGKGKAASSTSGWASIKNPDLIIAEVSKTTKGSIDLESWGRDLIGAQVVMPGTNHPASLDLSSGNTNVTVRLPLSGGGEATFRQGTFMARKVPLEAPDVAFPGAKFGGFKGVAADVALKADKDAVTLAISKLAYTTSTSRFQAPQSLVATGDATGSIESVVAAAGRGGDAIELQGPQITNLIADGKNCSYDLSGASLVGAGSCKVSVLKGSGAERNWSFVSDKPSTLFASRAVKTADAIEFKSVVKDNTEEFKGILKDAVVQFGAIGLQKQQMVLGNPASVVGPAGSVVKIPFNLEAAPGSSTWSLSLSDGKLSVEGTLSTAKIKGTVSLDLGDLSAYAIDIAKNDLAFQGKVAVTHEPYLYGAKPSYGALGLGFLADTELHITKDGGDGTVAANSDFLALTDAVIALGDEEESLVLNGIQNFSAGVVLAFDLKTGHGEVRTGMLDVAAVRVTNKPGKAGDLGGVRMWDGEATIKKLYAKFDDGKGRFAITDVGLKAKKLGAVPKASDSGAGNQLVWTGTLKTALDIKSIEGEIVKDSETKALKVAKPLISEATFGISDIQMGQGNSLRVRGGDLDVHLEKWGDDIAKGSLSITNSSIASREPNEHGQMDVRVGLQELKVNITDGTAKAPKGNGRLLTTGIDLKTDSMVEIKESCDDKPDFQGPKVRVAVTGGPSIVNFNVDGGALTGQGAVIGALAHMKSTETYTCAKKAAIDFQIWPEKIAKYHYPCPTWRYPTRMCEGWTRILPEFRITFDRKIEVRHLEVAGIFTAVALKLEGTDKIKACGKYGNVVPLADVSYYVTPHTSWDGLNGILDEVIKRVSQPFASALVSGLGFAAANWMTNIDENGLC